MNTIRLTPDIINNLSVQFFTEIIKTHLSYIDPSLIYYFDTRQLIIFLENAPLDTEQFRNYMYYANNETIDTIIYERPDLRGDLIVKLPFYHFEAIIRKYEAIYQYSLILSNKITANDSDIRRYEAYLLKGFTKEELIQNKAVYKVIYENCVQSLTPDQSTQLLFANRGYIHYASPSAKTEHPIGKLITEEIVVGILKFDPTCIAFLSLEYTRYFLAKYSDYIKTQSEYISYLSNDQLRYLIGELKGKQGSPIKYILKYMTPERIMYCITTGIIRIGEEHQSILLEFTPDQLIHIIKDAGINNEDKVRLIDLLPLPKQLLILQTEPTIIVAFTQGQRKALIDKGLLLWRRLPMF